MSATPDTTTWKLLGEHGNSRYFEPEPGVLVALPHPGSRDDQASARLNTTYQNAHFKALGRPGVVVVYFDNLVSQDKEARTVYRDELDGSLVLGTALVGGSMLARAIGSFFLGLSKPKIPLKMFGSTEDALAWARELNRAGRQGPAGGVT